MFEKEEFIVVMVTAPGMEEAEVISRSLVKEKLAACCSIVPKITSIYEWEGKVERAEECLIIIKTRNMRFAELVEEVTKLHSYDVPEIISIPVTDGFDQYLSWVWENSRSENDRLQT
jgi:periplasmic divalent cation tolerance protein